MSGRKTKKTRKTGLTSSEKGLKPFWNAQCAEISSKLWWPIETGFADSALISSNGSSKKAAGALWYSTTKHLPQKQSLPKTCSAFYTSSRAECTDSEITKSRLVRLFPTKSQRILFEKWISASREIYNFILLDIVSTGVRQAKWMDLKKEMTGGWPEHLADIPFQIKGVSIKEACDTFFDVLKRRKRGETATWTPRTRKDTTQSCFIPKTAVSPSGVYPRISGSGLRFAEALPDKFLDCRLVKRAGKFYLMTPYKTQRAIAESQGRIVALDPGIRNFQAYFAEGEAGLIASGDFGRLQRISQHLDNLLSRATKAGKQKKIRMLKASERMRERIRNLVNDLHWQVASWLCKNFDVILLPTFETKQMSNKSARKIGRKSVRAMLTFSHYKFKQKLKHKAFEYGKTVLDVCEAYTSKTHPETGKIFNVGGSKRIRTSLGWINRDISGARNILLRALVDRPDELAFVGNA